MNSVAEVIQTAAKVHRVLNKRLVIAQEKLSLRLQDVSQRQRKLAADVAASPWSLWRDWFDYLEDSSQRSLLFLDILRQRGNNYLAHEQAGKPPLLSFGYETVLDGRDLDRPVNYALVRIIPPTGVVVDEARRPYVILDPRAGHGPGIGGFKDDSQVGVALRAGHPVYFVIFFPEPVPGQQLLDVCAAEAAFVRRVRELHPESERPAIIGNCQGGWAAMMLAASDPEDVGPVVINGAPMSYWGGAWSEGDGDNPMRYAGGLLGGTWLASCVSDLANGKFDGAWLVNNFENLNPANAWWDKYYHVYANVDTEAPRFLEFERWWGGYYLMNREEIEWITRNLFVGNKLWSGSVPSADGSSFDLRKVKTPIVLFASRGDNITPPQQAFNWVADIYGSTEEIKLRGQVIVGLLHESIGHLGIFVSGSVAKKEHAQIVSVLESIEALPPGLYGMQIDAEEGGGSDGPHYKVRFEELRLEEVAQRINRFSRIDERPFALAAEVSEFNQHAYELFFRPLAQSLASETAARWQRRLHPLRMQRWAFSDINPASRWVKSAADWVRSRRRSLEPGHHLRQGEGIAADLLSAPLDHYRYCRDALSETAFFLSYGCLAASRHQSSCVVLEPRHDREFCSEDVLAGIAVGGYAEAVARVACLLQREGKSLPLAYLRLRRELFADYREWLPPMRADELRRIHGRQEIIVHADPEQALATLPHLVTAEADRQRLIVLLQKVLEDPRIQDSAPTVAQRAMFERICTILAGIALVGRKRNVAAVEGRRP